MVYLKNETAAMLRLKQRKIKIGPLRILEKDVIKTSFKDDPKKTIQSPRFFRVDVVSVAEYLPNGAEPKLENSKEYKFPSPALVLMG